MEAREFNELVRQNPDAAHKAAIEIMEKVEAQPRKWLFGNDIPISISVNAMFTLVPYTSQGEKRLGQAHILVDSEPGKGKTDMFSGIAHAIFAKYSRMDGKPDYTASDFTGGEVFIPSRGRFYLMKGPIFANIVLVDEINRAPPTAYAPVLGAMEERQVVLERTDVDKEEMRAEVHPLYPISEKQEDRDKLFFWLIATENPLEKGGSGVYPLGEAHLDRFAFSFSVDYPPRDDEKKIRAENVYSSERKRIEQVVDLETVLAISHFIFDRVRMTADANEYIQRLVENSRPKNTTANGVRPGATRELCEFVDTYVKCGLSARANFALEAGARTHAFRRGAKHISVEDVKAVASMVMRHRLVLTREAKAEGPDFIDRTVKMILEGTEMYSS